MLDKKTHKLISNMFESSDSTRSNLALLSNKDFSKVLNVQEISALNKVYEKFVFAEPMLMLESSRSKYNRAKLWEKFLVLEDELISEAPGDDRLAAAMAGEEGQGEKKQGFLSRAWDKVKKAAKAPLKFAAGKRSLSRMGRGGRDREAEFNEMIFDVENSIGELMKSMNDKVGNFASYPNNESNEEFQKMTLEALNAADEIIKQEQDPTKRAAMIEAVKKWISYVLDQKLGDFYKHFKEVSLSLGELLNEADDETSKKPERKGKLGTKSGESETVKGLKSNIAPAILGALGAAGLVAAGILKAHPDLLGSNNIEVIAKGDPTQVEELVTNKLGPVKITDWSAQGSADQVYQHVFGSKPTNSEDYIKLFKTFDPDGGDAARGAQNFFDAAGISNKNGQILNSNYVLDRLSKMSPDKAFDMPGVGPMERMGGRAGIPKLVTNIIVKQLTKKAVVGPITKVMASAGLGAAGAAALGAAGTLAAGGILSAIAVKLLRVKGLKDSRAAFLDNLIDQVGKEKEEEENKASSDPSSPPLVNVDDIKIDPRTGDVDIKPGDEGEEEDEDEGEEEAPGCDEKTLREKLTAALSSVKFKSGGPAAVEKMIKAVLDKQPSNLEDLKKMLNSNRTKPLRDATVTVFANAIADCFGFGAGGAGGKGVLSGSDLGNIVDNVMADMGRYEDIKSNNPKRDLRYRSVSKDVVTNLVKYLNDKGKLQYIEGDYNDDDGVIQRSLEDAESDEGFLRRIPPEYMSRMKNWNRSQPELANDVGDMLGDNKLPLYMLANRRALLETLKLIYRYARLLNENKGKNGAILLERWQKIAGVAK